MPLWEAGQPIPLKNISRIKLTQALWGNALHNQDEVSDTDKVIWDIKEVERLIKEHGYVFARLCGKDLNCDLSGDTWDPREYIKLHGKEACRVAIWKACDLEPPAATEQSTISSTDGQEPEENLVEDSRWVSIAQRVRENQGRR